MTDQMKTRLQRTTKETSVDVSVSLRETAVDPGDHGDDRRFETPLAFFNHMLEAFAVHAAISLQISGEPAGGQPLDPHHLVEDVGLVLGRAVRGEIDQLEYSYRRYGQALLPMDEALVEVAIDLSDRPFLVWNLELPPRDFQGFHTDLVWVFWDAFVKESRVNLHLHQRCGRNPHHLCEAAFKGVARAFRQALQPVSGVTSSKGTADWHD